MTATVCRFPGHSQSLSRFIDGSDIAAVTRGALDAIDVLRSVWEPLSAVGDGQHDEWSDLLFHAGRAWVGPAGWRSGEAELRLHYEAGTVVVPIERAPSGAWRSGPHEPAFDQPPLDVRLTNREGLVTLQITRHYDYWLSPSEPAAQRLDEIVDRLRVMGWGE